MPIAPHCISCFVIRQTNEGARYLLMRRAGKYLPGTWQMVTGGIEPGESAVEAALREVKEETSLTPFALYSADAVETFYIKHLNEIHLVPVFVAFVEDREVNLSPKEHDAYDWLAFEEAKELLLWSEQRRIIQEIQENFILNPPNPALLIDSQTSAQSPVCRIGVYAEIKKGNKILLVKQSKGPHKGKWDLPGGKIEAGETIQKALQRELKEELSLSYESAQFLKSLKAATKIINEQGASYIFYQLGLIYSIQNVSFLETAAEMEHAWLDLCQLKPNEMAPFVQQIDKP